MVYLISLSNLSCIIHFQANTIANFDVAKVISALGVIISVKVNLWDHRRVRGV